MTPKVSCLPNEMDDKIRIPASAVSVNVTNIINPYFMRIYETEHYTEKLNKIGKKLQQLMRNKGLKKLQDAEPETKDMVIVESNTSDVDLPAWLCRGVVGPLNPTNSKYSVFLSDHGVSVELPTNNLISLPHGLIPDSVLTSRIGLYNVVPVTMHTIPGDQKMTLSIAKQWTNSAIQFVREMISASQEVYFHHLASDEFGNKFGEVYLVIEDEIAALSKDLVLNQFAIYLEKDILELIENKNQNQDEKESPITRNSITNCHQAKEESDECSTSDNVPNETKRYNRSSAAYPRVFQKQSKSSKEIEEGTKMLICSKRACEQLSTVSDARFPMEIHKSLQKLRVNGLLRIQKHIWPAVRQGFNVLAVNPPNSGKTYGYLVPIVSLIAENTIYSEVPKENGPLALILCSSSSEVSHVYSTCLHLLENCPQIMTVRACNGITDKDIVTDLYNGCDILISTPPFLARFMDSHRKVFSIKRLCHLVLDGADIILDKYFGAIGELFKKHDVIWNKERRVLGASQLQIVAVAERCTKALRKFVTTSLHEPYICIGSYMESAVYAGLQSKVFLIPNDQKFEKTLELMDDDQPMIKTMIVCTQTEEVKKLNDILTSGSKQTLVAHGEMMFTEIHGIRESWMASVSGNRPVLICTDEVLSDLDITDVERLIHFSITSPSKSQFYFRFSTMMDNYSRNAKNKENTNCRVIILADENNEVQFKGIVAVMERLGSKIPPKILHFVEQISVKLDREKKGHPICDNVKALGFCPSRNSCPSRHCILPEVDKPTTSVKIGDAVTLAITTIHTPTHFSARVVECTNTVTKETKKFSSQEFTLLSLKMTLHYANSQNRKSNKAVSVGDVCTCETAIDTFSRVQVLSIIKRDGSGLPKVVIVRCIDNGSILDVSASQLLEIPEELLKWPSHLVEVFLTGVAPCDNEYIWNDCAENAVYDWLKSEIIHGNFVFAKVLLHVGNTLWVDPLEIRAKVIDHPDLVTSSLKSLLVDKKYGTENKDHLSQLYALCRGSGVTNINGCEIP